MFQLPIEYNPAQVYTRQELVNVIKSQAQVLCFFATMGRGVRCVLGLDFDNYNPAQQMIPVHIIPTKVVKEMFIPTHGKRFKHAYQSSRLKRSIIITYQSPYGAGWFKLKWQLDETMVFTSE
jgi:hypothetical protein